MKGDVSKARRSEKLALLVGANPLPNYLAATVLQAKEVVLLYSPETLKPRDHLKAVFTAKGMGVSERCVSDATDARRIREACDSLNVDHLHYSGGTKPMAAHALATLSLCDTQKSYLDERNGLLRFDDGYDIRLGQCELDLSLDRVLKLHGAARIEKRSPTAREETVNSSSPNSKGCPAESDESAIYSAILNDPALADKLYRHFRRDENDKAKSCTDAKKAPLNPLDHGIELTASKIPDSTWTTAQYDVWVAFLCGGWLESWTARLIRSHLGASTAVEVSVHCKLDRTTFEIDVALIRGHRLYVVSCTTEHKKKDLCKSKLFEVAMRARQMGGDLARSALVCLIDGNNNKGSYVDQLRSDIAGVWDAPNVPNVFGLADLREWAGTSGMANTESLKKWLDS